MVKVFATFQNRDCSKSVICLDSFLGIKKEFLLVSGDCQLVQAMTLILFQKSSIDMAQSTLENGQKAAGVLGVLGVLSVLVTWEMNFLCISSIFCDFESKVPKSIYTRKMPKKAW